MLKDAFVVGAVAAAAVYGVDKWGDKLTAKAIEMKIPPTAARAGIVAGATMGVYALAKVTILK